MENHLAKSFSASKSNSGYSKTSIPLQRNSNQTKTGCLINKQPAFAF